MHIGGKIELIVIKLTAVELSMSFWACSYMAYLQRFNCCVFYPQDEKRQ